MLPLARFWTWVGHLFIPLAVGWAVYVSNGLAIRPPPSGVLVSRAYWGLAITLLVGNALGWTIALYVRAAKEKKVSILVPPNTTFEEKNARNKVISIGTIIVFTLSVILALAVFGKRYSESQIYRWNDQVPVESGFWASRISAHEEGCNRPPCFAVGQRVDASIGPMFGVNEYILYFTDGALVMLAVSIFVGLGFLLQIIFLKQRPFIL